MATAIFSLPTGHLELSDLSFNSSNENIFSSSFVEELLPKCNLQKQCVCSLEIARLLKWQTAVRIGDLCMAKSGPRQPPKEVFYTQRFLSQNLALFDVLLRHLCNCRSSCRLAILQSTRELFLSFWFKLILSLNRTYFYLLRAFEKMLKISNMTFKAVLFFCEIFGEKQKHK